MLFAACLLPYLVLWGKPAFLAALRAALVSPWLIPALGLGVVAHEGLHGLGWALFGRISWREVQFGFDRLGRMPFARCRVPLPVSAYRVGGALPALVMGVAPLLVGSVSGTGWLAVWGALFLAMASGDLLILWATRSAGAQAHILGHPGSGTHIVISAAKTPAAPTRR